MSTQSLTAVLIDPVRGDLQARSVHFDSKYPAYGTENGVLRAPDPQIVHADPRMWVEALDDMCAWLKKQRLSGKIRGIGVSAQQHGTVYLKPGAFEVLAGVTPARPLSGQIHGIFSRHTSPVWMDSSTFKECEEITVALGGDKEVAARTGSIATERFAGPQIRKFWKQESDAYENTAHIALISSFITSILIGRPAPVDAGDGYGTNLADIRTGSWSRQVLERVAPDLQKRLPELKTSDEVAGPVSAYLVRRHGFSPEAKVVIGSGDNPSSLVGLGLLGKTAIHAISLGTSDTYFGYLPGLRPGREETAHLFGTADGKYMFLICFQNGSLARKRIKDAYGLDWRTFSDILLRTPPGNGGRILLPYFFPEITPKVTNPCVRRYGGLDPSDPEGNVRAVVEAQAMAMYLHSFWIGIRPQEILVTAGGSQNPGLIQVLADVFGIPVHACSVRESAALGAAFRAARACRQKDEHPLEFEDLYRIFLSMQVLLTSHPSPRAAALYHGKEGLLEIYRDCERHALRAGDPPFQRIKAFQKRLSSLP